MSTSPSPSNGGFRKVGRALAFSTLYPAYLAVFVVAVCYLAFWRPYVADLENRNQYELEPPRHVEAATMRRLGALRADRASSFSRFEPDKRAGVIRLCAVGDSFTYGDEAADGHDFPAFLQEIFTEDGADNVEVLNFGNPWYGFHQAYVLWDEVGRNFQCDVVLLGPDCFQPDRDTTFNHALPIQPYYLHARYVLDDDDVRLVEVEGADARERFDGYFRFWPPWRYLRYDRRPPAAVQSIIGQDRSLANPLYYSRSSQRDEAHATYQILLRRLAGDAPQVLMLHALGEIVAIADGLDAVNVVAIVAERNERFPYHAPGGHFSSFGNRRLAEEYHAQLVSHATRITELVFEDLDPAGPQGEPHRGRAADPTGASPAALSDYARIELRMAGGAAGLLATLSPDPGQRVGSDTMLGGSSSASLVALKPPGLSAIDAAYVALPTPLGPDHEVTLRAVRDGKVDERVIGRLRRAGPRANVAVAEIAGLTLRGADLFFDGSDVVGRDFFEGGADVTLRIGPSVALRAASGWPVHLKPAADPLLHFRVGAGQYVDVDSLDSTGIVTLALVEKSGAALEIPLVRWRKQPRAPLAGPRRLPRLISVDGSRARLEPAIGKAS